MAAWELALIIFAVTYMVVNTTYLMMQVKMLNQMKGAVSKAYKLMEKMMDKSEKYIDEMFDEL